jgi:hypothetical protein
MGEAMNIGNLIKGLTALGIPKFAKDANGNVIGLQSANGGKVAVSSTAQARPIIAVTSYVGNAQPNFIDFGFDADLVIVKGAGQNAVIFTKEQWYGNVQSFGNTVQSGSDAATIAPAIQPTGISLTSSLAAINSSGVTYYAVAIKDNGSGILKTFAYNGYRYQTTAANGTNSDPVTMDLIAGTYPQIVHIKRDAVSTGHEGVWATPSWVKKESADAVNNALLTLASDGTMSLSTDISVNENDGGTVGEATNCFSLHNSGTYWDLLSYTGTGAAQRIAANGDVAAAFVIPQAAAAMQFWISGMGSNSADGGQTTLYSNRLTAGNGFVSVGSDASVNTVGVTYALIVFYKSGAYEKRAPTTRRGGVRISTISSGHISCGTDASLGIAGAHSLEWIGAISDATSEQFIMGRIGNASTGSRGSPTAGSCNYAMSYTHDPDAGLEICTSDQFSNLTTAVSKQQRWRTGIILRPYTPIHLLYTHDGVDKWILYVNGVAVKWRRLSMNVFGINGITNTAGLTMSFGGRISAGTWAAADRTTHRFGRIYNRALTATEVAQMFARNFLGATINDLSDSATSLVEEWKFNEATGTTVTATKNANNNGTITSGVWVP